MSRDRLPSMATLSLVRRTETLCRSCLTPSSSSLPTCRATCLPSFCRTSNAAPCQPPKVSREAELASLVGDIRRQLSFRAVQQQARLLLDRLHLLGDGATEAGRRRDWAIELEAAAARRRGAHEVSRRQGHNIMRHGFGQI